jgi:hypothetical protein
MTAFLGIALSMFSNKSGNAFQVIEIQLAVTAHMDNRAAPNSFVVRDIFSFLPDTNYKSFDVFFQVNPSLLYEDKSPKGKVRKSGKFRQYTIVLDPRELP